MPSVASPLARAAGGFRRVFQGQVTASPVCDTKAATALLEPALAGLDHEQFHVLYLDEHLALVGHERLSAGGGGVVDVPLRALFGQALTLDSRAMILAHNHPTRDCTPSRADLMVTRRIVEVARPLGIMVLDHLIFSRSGNASFRQRGLI